MTIGLYFLIGLCAGGRVSIGINYMAEFLPEKSVNICMTMINVFDACLMIFQSILYYYGRSWVPIHIIGLVGALFILVLV